MPKKKKTTTIRQADVSLFPMHTPFGVRYARVPALYTIWGQAGRGKTTFALATVLATHHAMTQTQAWLRGELETPPPVLVPQTQFIFATLGAERAPISPSADTNPPFSPIIIQSSDGRPPQPEVVAAAIAEEVDDSPGLFLVVDGISAGKYDGVQVGARALWQEDLMKALTPLLYKKYTVPVKYPKDKISLEEYKDDAIFGGKKNYIGGFVVVIFLAQARASVDSTMRQVAPAVSYSLRHSTTLIYAKGGQQSFVFSPQAGEATRDARIPQETPETVYKLSYETLNKIAFGFTEGKIATVKYTVEVTK